MSVSLRRAVVGDIPFIMRAERGEGYQAQKLVGLNSAEEHRAALADPGKAYFIAEDGGEALGFILLNDVRDPARVRLRRVVALVPDRGLGRVMVPAMLDWIFMQTGTEAAWLHTQRFNARARHVYERAGMTVEVPEPLPANHDTHCVYAISRTAWTARRDAG